jgi:hypothetical protein
MCSGRGDGPLRPPGFPIRKSPDLSLVADSPGLIAGSYVLLRLLVPRHPPCALINLATTDDARVHCAVLKIRAVPDLHRRVAKEIRSDRGNQPSGRSLRTQQRARPAQPLGSGVPCRGARRHLMAVLASPGSCPDRITSAPLMSCHPRLCCLQQSASDMALGAVGRSPTSARCSLERR